MTTDFFSFPVKTGKNLINNLTRRETGKETNLNHRNNVNEKLSVQRKTTSDRSKPHLAVALAFAQSQVFADVTCFSCKWMSRKHCHFLTFIYMYTSWVYCLSGRYG
jgi:hypothetical protein